MAEFQRESKTFSQVLDFTRGSTGTYFDASGVLQTAAVDEPRFTYDPVTGTPEGLLIEEQRTNLLLWSEAFDNAYWSKIRATVTPDAVAAPDAALAADKISENLDSGTHRLSRSVTLSSDGKITIFAKAAERSALTIAHGHSPFNISFFDLANGVAKGVGNPEIVALPEGWYRCTSKWSDLASSSNIVFEICLDYAAETRSYTGDGSSGLYIWGAQLEQGSFPTSYIKTEGSQVTRSADNCSRTLGSEFNASEGRVEVTATANIGDTVIALGTESIVADVDTEKTYTMTYNTDPSATTLDIMPGATGTVKSVKYSPRETA